VIQKIYIIKQTLVLAFNILVVYQLLHQLKVVKIVGIILQLLKDV